MPNDVTFLDIVLLGKEYRVACPPEEREALQAAVAFVDGKMHEIAEKTRSNISERIAVMAALNIAHEHLNLKASADTPQLTAESETGVDIAALMRRIQDMEAQLDAALASQEKLF
ncbi:cell division protein ZapA [Propionivibrio dicarboxylicus]|uniref:Cell division protein ZapA n=1 Tax=Propionivibrio dicarboxylicus TaxID=83767 RepID=A0A1G7UWQ5_9RHOO|nr:cell division protein ZapA [Propionivibrio dicarboxylicus]SDG51973.1 cell division protein ZapA [Propionivibrio dicarboxylicus]